MVKSLEQKKPRVLQGKTPAKLRVVTAPPPATNQPDAETFHYHVGALVRQKAKIDAERKVMRDLRRRANDSGLNLASLDRIIRMRELEPETVQAEIRRDVQYAEWMGLAPPGTQGDLFKDLTKKLDEEQAAEDAAYRDGIEGNKGPAIEPERYDMTTIIGQARMRGWNRGQEVLHERFLAKNAKQAETVQ